MKKLTCRQICLIFCHSFWLFPQISTNLIKVNKQTIFFKENFINDFCIRKHRKYSGLQWITVWIKIRNEHKMSRFQRVQQWSAFSKSWHLYDAKWQNPFHSARKLTPVLEGKSKPIYRSFFVRSEQYFAS